MKKVITIIFIAMLFCACGMSSARSEVENYLKKYKTLNSEVLVDLEKVVNNENLTNSDKDKYRDILKKQYKDLQYEILDEEYDGDNSYVTVKITVYDLYKAQKYANNYLANHSEEFTGINGNYDELKFASYKLEQMKDMTERVDYTITFKVTKEKDKYVVSQPTENDLMKLHGIYNYEVD